MRRVMAFVLAAGCMAAPGAAQSQDQQKTVPPVNAAGGGVRSTEGQSEIVKIPGVGPQAAVAPVDKKTYLIGPEDVLRVIIWQQTAIPPEYIVRPDGMISVPLAGEVKADGLTAEQLERAIAQRLKDGKIILDPSVTVQVMAVRSKKIYISGEVNRPGPMDLVVPTKVSQALAAAGGFKDFAKTKKIRIVRANGEVLHYNHNEVSHGKNLKQDIYLEPGDQIYVD